MLLIFSFKPHPLTDLGDAGAKGLFFPARESPGLEVSEVLNK